MISILKKFHLLFVFVSFLLYSDVLTILLKA